MEWMLLPYRRYAEFYGRSRRRELWMFWLFTVLVNVALNALFGVPTFRSGPMWFDYGTHLTGLGRSLQGLFSLVTIVPGLAVAVRRLHDIERSGWWLLLWLVPFLGWFTLLVFFLLDGTRGVNRFGPDPKERGTADLFR